jgi:hypothetical protein
VGQLLDERRSLSESAIQKKAGELLSGKDAELHQDHVSAADLARFDVVINECLDQWARHQQHFGYSWSDVAADPSLFRSFFREVLQ